MKYTSLYQEFTMACSYWSGEKGIGCGRESVVTDLNSTALGLRTLRLHGYPVSSGWPSIATVKNSEFWSLDKFFEEASQAAI